MSLETAISIKNSELCRYDSLGGFLSFFNDNGDIDGWDIYNNIYMYNSWNGILFGRTDEDSCYIGRTNAFDYIPCDIYYTVNIVMKVVPESTTQGELTKGRIQWITVEDNIWDTDRLYDFDIYNDGKWHKYSLNMGPHKYWIGSVNNLRVYPFIDAWPADFFAIESISISAVNDWDCLNKSCSYYTAGDYIHPCTGVGRKGSCISGESKSSYTLESGVSDELIINIDGYGEEKFDLGNCADFDSYEMCRRLSKHISGLNIGGYSYCNVEVDELDRDKIKISSGTFNADSSVEILDSPAARELGFFNTLGTDISVEELGTVPADGFDFKSSRLLTSFEITRIIDGTINSSSYLHSPSIYSVEVGRRDYSETSSSYLTSAYNGGFLFTHSMGNSRKTLIDISNPVTSNGKLAYAYMAGKVCDNDEDSKIKIYRPYKDGTFKEIYSVDVVEETDSDIEFYTVDFDVLVNRGDVIGVYNIDLCIPSIAAGMPDATFYHVDGEATGTFDSGNLYIGGSSGFSIYAKSNRKQSTVVLDIDLGKRINIEKFNVYGAKDDYFEYNISSCKDFTWEVDMYSSTHTHVHKNGSVDHDNLAYGEEALNDNITIAQDPEANLTFGVGDDGYWTSGVHTYCYVNGDNEFKDPGVGAVDNSLYREERVTWKLDFPNEVTSDIYKSKIYFKDEDNLKGLELSYYLGAGSSRGNISNGDSTYKKLVYTTVKKDGETLDRDPEDSLLDGFYDNPCEVPGAAWRLIEHRFDTVSVRGFRIDSTYHLSTKLTEIELYSLFPEDVPLSDVSYVSFSSYGDVWQSSVFEKDDSTSEDLVVADIANAPRYIVVEFNSRAVFNLNFIETIVGSQVKLADCSDDLLLEDSKTNTINESTAMILENVYDRPFDLTVDIPKQTIDTDTVLLWNKLGSQEDIDDSEVGPACVLNKRSNYKFLDRSALCMKENECYGLKNLVSGKTAYSRSNEATWVKWPLTLREGVDVDYGSDANYIRNNLTFDDALYKYYKVYAFDVTDAGPTSLVNAVGVYYNDGEADVDEVRLNIGNVFNDEIRYETTTQTDRTINFVPVVYDNFTTGSGIPSKHSSAYVNSYVTWEFPIVNIVNLPSPLNSFELRVSNFTKDSAVLFYDDNDNILLALLPRYYNYFTGSEYVMAYSEEVMLEDFITHKSIRCSEANDYVRLRRMMGYMGIWTGIKELYELDYSTPPGDLPNASTTGWIQRPFYKIGVIKCNIELDAIPSLSPYEELGLHFSTATALDEIRLYTRALSSMKYAVYAANNDSDYVCLASSDYESDNLAQFNVSDYVSNKTIVNYYVRAVDESYMEFLPWVSASSSGTDTYYIDTGGNRVVDGGMPTYPGSAFCGNPNFYDGRFWVSKDGYPHWIKYDFGKGYKKKIEKVEIIFGQKSMVTSNRVAQSNSSTNYRRYYKNLGGCPAELYIQGSNTGEDDTVYSDDITNIIYDHYSDNSLGVATNVSDNDLDTFTQNFTYLAIDFGIGITKIVMRLNLYILNSYAFNNVNNGVFQGSNNSTNGVDGDWYELIDLSNLSVPAEYPGWAGIDVVTNLGPYRWYRISGTPKANNTHILEWEMLEALDSGTIYSETWGENSTNDYTNVTDDSYLTEALPDGNKSSESSLIVGNVSSYSQRPVIRFDLSSLDSNYIVYNATLNLYHYGGGGTTAHTVSVYRCLQDWINSEVTWNSIESSILWNTSGADNASNLGVDGGVYDRYATAEDSDSIINTATDGWKSWNITDVVNQWIKEEIENNGLVVKSSLEGTLDQYVNFYASDDTSVIGTDKRPYISITYGPQEDISGWITLHHTTDITPSNVTYEGSYDGESLYSVDPITNVFEFDNDNYYRFYRVYMTTEQVDSEEWVTAYQINMKEKFPGPGSSLDAAYLKPSVASSYILGHFPEKANDNNVSTYWSSVSGTSAIPSNWYVDMENIVPIKKISVTLGFYDYAYTLTGGKDDIPLSDNRWSRTDNSLPEGYYSFSDGDLTIRSWGGWYNIRSIFGMMSGKWYWEVDMTGGSLFVGVENSAAVSTHYPGRDEHGWGYYYNYQRLYHNNVYVSYLPEVGSRTFPIGIAIDIDAGKMWLRLSDEWNGDPVAGTNPAFDNITTGEIIYPSIGMYRDSNWVTTTTNFGATDFNYDVPTGFNPIDERVWETILKEDVGQHSPTEHDDLEDLNYRYLAITTTDTSHPTNASELLEFSVIPYGVDLTATPFTNNFAVDLGQRYAIDMVRNYGTGSFEVGIGQENTIFSSSDTSDVDSVVWAEEQSFIDNFNDGTYLDNWVVEDSIGTVDSVMVEDDTNISVYSYGTPSGVVWYGPTMTYSLSELVNDFNLDITFRCGNDTGVPYAGTYIVDFLYQNHEDPVMKLRIVNPANGEVDNTINEYLYDNSDPDNTIRVERWGENSTDHYNGLGLIDDRYISSFNWSGTDYRPLNFEGVVVGIYYKALVKFDLSAIEGAEIIEAKLRMRSKNNGGFSGPGDYKDIELYRCYKPWVSTDICWYYYSSYDGDLSWGTNGARSVSDYGEDDGSFDHAETPFATQRVYQLEYETWFSWDLTDMVRKWTSGEIKNYGFAVGPWGGDSWIHFYDSWDVDGYRPYLEVKYKSNGLIYTGTGEISPYGTTNLNLERNVSASQLVYKINNITRYVGDITTDPFSKVRITYERYDTSVEYQQPPAEHNTSYLELYAITEAADVRWIRFDLDFDGFTTQYIKRLGIYPDISVNTAPGGGLNCEWVNLGDPGRLLTSSYINTDLNYALMADVTSNYSMGDCIPENAVDGFLDGAINSGWAFDVYNNVSPYIVVDFGKEIGINSVALHHGPADGDRRYNNFPSIPECGENKYKGYLKEYLVDGTLPTSNIWNDMPLTFEVSTSVSGDTDWVYPWISGISKSRGEAPNVVRYYEQSYTKDVSGNTYHKFGLVNARRLRISFLDWNSIRTPFFNSSLGVWEIFRGSYLREIEVFNTAIQSGKIYSEQWPILAFDLRYMFKITNIDYDTSSRRRTDIEFKYSGENYSDPHKVSFNEDNGEQIYASTDSSEILNYVDDNGNLQNTSYSFDSDVFLNEGSYAVTFDMYNIEDVSTMYLSLQGNTTYNVYPTTSGTLSGTGQWLSFEESVYVEENSYFEVLGNVSTSGINMTANNEWGVRYPTINKTTSLRKRWLAAEIDKEAIGTNTLSWIKAYADESFVLTEYSLWWDALLSDLSDDIFSKVGNTALKVAYPDSSKVDVVKYFGSGIGKDSEWNIKDSLCFWLYISNINKLDLDTFYVYCGKSASSSDDEEEIDAYYIWKVSDCNTLTSGWNRVNLPFSKYTSYVPVSFAAGPKVFLFSQLDFAFNNSPFSLFQMEFSGKGEAFDMRLDDIIIRRNRFDDDVKFGKGLCLVNLESLELPLSNVNLGRGTIEFWFKSYTTAQGRDLFNRTFSRNLFSMSSSTNTLSLGIEATSGFQITVSQDTYENIKHAIPIVYGSQFYFGFDDIMHLVLVWDNTGTFIDGSKDTLRLYYDNNLIYSSTDKWDIFDSSPSSIRFGGSPRGECYEIESFGSGIFENIKMYNYCRTDFDNTILEDVKNIYTANDFVEISEDDINFHGSSSSALPLVFENVPVSGTRTVYVRSSKDDNFNKSRSLTADVYVEWEVSV